MVVWSSQLDKEDVAGWIELRDGVTCRVEGFELAESGEKQLEMGMGTDGSGFCEWERFSYI